MRWPEDRASQGVRVARVRGPSAPTLADWEREAKAQQARDREHQARLAREELARRVMREFAKGAHVVQVVAMGQGRAWIGDVRDLTAAKVWAENEPGQVGRYTDAIEWHALLADLEEARL